MVYRRGYWTGRPSGKKINWLLWTRIFIYLFDNLFAQWSWGMLNMLGNDGNTKYNVVQSSVEISHYLQNIRTLTMVTVGWCQEAWPNHSFAEPETISTWYWVTRLDVLTTLNFLKCGTETEVTILYLKWGQKPHLNFEIGGDFWGIWGSLRPEETKK